MLPFAFVRAYKPKDAFGDPRVFLGAMPKDGEGLPVNGTYAKMGTIIGTADGVKVSKRESPQGGTDFYYGLSGTFEAMPVDPEKRNPQRMNTAWLPEEWQGAIEGMLKERIDHKTGETIKNETGADSVDFAFDVGVVADRKSSTGFVWRHTPRMEMSASADPLHALRAKLQGDYPALSAPKHPQIVGPEDGAPASHEDAGESGEHVDDEIEAQSGNAAIAQTANKPTTAKGRK